MSCKSGGILGYTDHVFSLMRRFDFFWLLCVNFLYLTFFGVHLEKMFPSGNWKRLQKNFSAFSCRFNLLILVITPKSVCHICAQPGRTPSGVISAHVHVDKRKVNSWCRMCYSRGSSEWFGGGDCRGNFETNTELNEIDVSKLVMRFT